MKENIIEEVLKTHIKETNSIFVFPTQNAADLWADRIIFISECSAVSMERFIAWDNFKSDSIRGQHQDKISIPSTMRQIFATQLTEQNKKEPFLSYIITKEYAQNGNSFSTWISNILPSLSMWKKYFENNHNEPDDEDKDLLKIYELYNDFLNKYSLFDPAWETPPFSADGNHYYIFFPEILSDYKEYKSILESSPADITIIPLPKNDIINGKVNFFKDSRVELKSIVLYLRKIHEEEKIEWNDIAISVPDLDTYEPYIKRELDIYCIPNVTRYAKPLSSTRAGALFKQLFECYSENFSYDSLKNLLLNTDLPWKEKDEALRLLNFGKENNCICSFKYDDKDYDIWVESFKEIGDERIKIFYSTLKDYITKIVTASSFTEIKNRYFIFREKYFNMDNCTAQADNIISRCISELSGLIDLEENYPECKIPFPYSFFVNQLNSIKYLNQTSENGVYILSYKTAACSPFACHIIIDSSQTGLSVIYKPLTFLREDKRIKLLGGLSYEDPNVTKEFIQLYQMNSYKIPAFFTAASKTFSGYSQSISFLEENDYTKTENPYIKDDFYKTEKDWFLGNNPPEKIFDYSRKGFENWKKSQNQKDDDNSTSIKIIQEMIQTKRINTDELMKVSNSSLNSFFKCSRLWLFKNIINLKEQKNETALMDDYKVGNLYHKILENFFKTLKKNNKNIMLKQETEQNEPELPEEYLEYINQSIEKAITDKTINSCLERELLKTTKDALTQKMTMFITNLSKKFNNYSVYDVEKDFSYPLKDKKIILEGKIDLILQNPEDFDFTIIDYKTSKEPKNLYYTEESNTLPDFQLPLYIYYLKSTSTKNDVDKALFYKINEIKTKEFELENYDSTIKKVLECIDEYSKCIQENNFESNTPDFKDCLKCSYKAICRKTFNISRKY